MNARCQQLIEELNDLSLNGQFPESWKPTIGELLSGWVLRYGDAISKLGVLTKICTIGTDEGRLVGVWVSSTVLKGEFERQNPTIGERVRIRYLGKPAGKTYHKYIVLVDRTEAAAGDFRDSRASPGPEEPDSSTDRPYAAATMRGGYDEDPFAD